MTKEEFLEAFEAAIKSGSWKRSQHRSSMRFQKVEPDSVLVYHCPIEVVQSHCEKFVGFSLARAKENLDLDFQIQSDIMNAADELLMYDETVSTLRSKLDAIVEAIQ